VSIEVLQGWRPDPFGRYEERYFSDGVATALVRTDRVEANDQPGGPLAPFDAPAPRPVVRNRVVECVLVRRRPWRRRFILALSFLVVPLAIALLAPTGWSRMMMLLTLAGAAGMVAVLVGGSTALTAFERRHRPV
jgi:hypothetical protein